MSEPAITKAPPRVALVVPCYNEEEVLPMTLPVLLDILGKLTERGLAAADSYVLCSNDGSRDRTWDIISRFNDSDPRVKGISLAHNRGHQNALLAGLMRARRDCDVSISLDADLQDSPETIFEMMEMYHAGYDIVYGVRSDRSSDTWFKRVTAHGFYRFQRAMGLETVFDHADFRLLDRRALDCLSEYDESNLFLRGIMPHIGLKWTTVTYRRSPRCAGESKYPLKAMLSLSIDGITSFTAKPMRLIFLTGLVMLLADIGGGIWVFTAHWLGQTISGWSSLMLSLWFLGSLVLIALGIIGEYIGKIFVEVKHRPRFHVAEETKN